MTLEPLSPYAEAWLTLALGSDKAAAAMALPIELRQEIYHDILNYGPAGDLINEFCFRLNAVHKASESELIEVASKVLDTMERIGNTMQDGAPPATDGFIVNDLNCWASESGYDQLQRTFYKVSYTLLGKMTPDMADGMYCCLWLLNGQYLFPKHLVEVSRQCWSDMNNILALLDLDPLNGLLSTATVPLEEQ